MKKLIITLTFVIVAIVNVNAQEIITTLNIQGVSVKIEQGKKFSYKGDSEVDVLVKDGVMSASSNSDKKPTLTIIAPDVAVISISNGNIEVSGKISLNALTLNMSNASIVSIDAAIKEATVNMVDKSKLVLATSIKDLTCNMGDQSILESADFTSDNVKLITTEQATVNMKMKAKYVSIIANKESTITLRGTSDVLKCVSEENSKILTSQLVVNRAQVISSTSCLIAVNAKQLMGADCIKNYYKL